MKMALAALVAGAGIASAGVDYLVSDGSDLYRGTIGGGPAQKFTFAGGEHLIGMTIVPVGAQVNGASAGDVIAVDDQDSNGRGYNIYRVDNAFSGTPTLSIIGVSNRVSNSLAFRQSLTGGWELYGANGLGQTFKLHSLDLNTFAGVADFDSGFGVLGVGGLQFANSNDAFFTVNGTDSVNAYDFGANSGSAIGASGTTFTNNGLEFLDGTLYGSVGLNSGRIAVGTWNTVTGAFNQLEDVAPYSGGVMGFVVVPAPGTFALLGLGGLVATRRRR